MQHHKAMITLPRDARLFKLESEALIAIRWLNKGSMITVGDPEEVGSRTVLRLKSEHGEHDDKFVLQSDVSLPVRSILS